jgi:hypothetical protein
MKHTKIMRELQDMCAWVVLLLLFIGQQDVHVHGDAIFLTFSIATDPSTVRLTADPHDRTASNVVRRPRILQTGI